ncbi:hypothetical protein ACFV6U_39835, partial [Streptomyces sp. NPDC059810]
GRAPRPPPAPPPRAARGPPPPAVVRHMADEENCAVLLVEHDVAFVMELCSRVVVLDLGRVLAEGSAGEVHADPVVREAYLGTGGGGVGGAERDQPGRRR